VTTVLLSQPDDLPPRTTTVDITAPRFELHREGDAFRVGRPGDWHLTELARVPEVILALAAIDDLYAGTLVTR
jgi:hypothetical protein